MFLALPLLLILILPVLAYFAVIKPEWFSSRKTKKDQQQQQQQPPSPSRLPIIGNLHQLGSLPHASLHRLSQKHGPVMLLQMGRIPTLVVSSADAAREVMKTHDHAFASRPSLVAAKQMLYDCKDVGFSPYGEYWRQVRKISILHLLSAKRVQSYQHVREQEVASMIAQILRRCAAGPINMSEILSSLSNEIISRVALGKKYNSSYQQEDGEKNMFCDLIGEFSALFGEIHIGDYFPSLGWLSILTGMRARMMRCFRKLDSFLEQVIEDHREGHNLERVSEHQDLVDVLLSLQRDHDMVFTLTKDNIKAILLDMFAGGTETSYIVLEWTMAELVRSPRVLEKVQDEVRGILKSNPMVTENDISQMNYLEIVIKEVLRLHPPAPLLVPRESICDSQVQGYKIPSRTRVMVNAWSIGRDPKYWVAPYDFSPERFIKDPSDFKGHDFQFIPFGAGRRICPGMSFATTTIKLALANLLHQFDWKLPDGMSPEELDMTESKGLGMRMKNNLILVAVPQ